MRRVLLAALVLLPACGGAPAAEPVAADPRELSRYGIELRLPDGWDGRIGRGAVHAASFPLPREDGDWMRSAAKGLGRGDALVLLFENEPRPENPGGFPALDGPLRLEQGDFAGFDGITEDSRATGHGYARRLFSVAGRDFVLFAETGSQPPAPKSLARLDDLLGSLRVERGDFYRGTVEPARFTARRGWETGTSGPVVVRADGDWVTSWASTVPYADEWNALPPRRTLERLPRDGVLIWLGLERNNRFPPGASRADAVRPLFRLEDFERQPGWEGQVRDLPQYVLHGTVAGEYTVDVRVWFGRPEPSRETQAEAQAMLDGLRLPEWGPWELD